MTKTPNSTVTTIQIRRAGSIALSMSYDCTDSGTSIPLLGILQLQIDQAIVQWWNSLTNFQRSALGELRMNLKISGNCPESQRS